ncbi:hypothetical protein [Streptomyces sp. TRM64462]|uniref:hypothetical protein n=1 Tax=Streptomyces sp. TRM64462 TaxID=2741726 RepID=UPI0015868E23|nr:hypothetical protein [Streptomyces sp. TRM64462]
MTDPICRIAAWFRLLFAPGSGRRRAGACPTAADPATRPQAAPIPLAPRLPALRSPYGQHELFDGATVALVRPYLVAHERRQERLRKQRRRLTLVLAADFGIDLDTRVLHGSEVAR